MQYTYDAAYLVIHRAGYLKALAKEAKELGVTIHLDSVDKSIAFARASILLEVGKTRDAGLIIDAEGERSFRCDALLGYHEPPHPSGDIGFRNCHTGRDAAGRSRVDWLNRSSCCPFPT